MNDSIHDLIIKLLITGRYYEILELISEINKLGEIILKESTTKEVIQLVAKKTKNYMAYLRDFYLSEAHGMEWEKKLQLKLENFGFNIEFFNKILNVNRISSDISKLRLILLTYLCGLENDEYIIEISQIFQPEIETIKNLVMDKLKKIVNNLDLNLKYRVNHDLIANDVKRREVLIDVMIIGDEDFLSFHHS